MATPLELNAPVAMMAVFVLAIDFSSLWWSYILQEGRQREKEPFLPFHDMAIVGQASFSDVGAGGILL
jgi:hypothetical protein